jgi:uncharacterized membrane protein
MPEPTRSPEEQHAADRRLDTLLGNLLRFGVLLSAAVVLGGGTYYLFQHGREAVPNYGDFVGQPVYLESLSGIFIRASEGGSRGITMVGIILLIGTPIARVVFSVFAFAVERDYLYVIVTLIVLAILLYSLLFGG